MKILLFVLLLIQTVGTLFYIHKEKKKFQVYPDVIKKDLYRSVRTSTILSTTAAALCFVCLSLLKSDLFFVFVFLCFFLNLSSVFLLVENEKEIV